MLATASWLPAAATADAGDRLLAAVAPFLLAAAATAGAGCWLLLAGR